MDTATTEIYTLSLHNALPISRPRRPVRREPARPLPRRRAVRGDDQVAPGHVAHLPPRRRRLARSEEHTSELQSRQYLVCRLLLEKKKTAKITLERMTQYISLI